MEIMLLSWQLLTPTKDKALSTGEYSFHIFKPSKFSCILLQNKLICCSFLDGKMGLFFAMLASKNNSS